MEKDIVTLNIKRYNELYDLEKAVKEGKCLAVIKEFGYGFPKVTTQYYKIGRA